MRKPFSYKLLKAYQNNRCFYCGGLMKNNQTKDHFFPASFGLSLIGNVVFACRPCNQAKGDILPTREEIIRFEKLYQHFQIRPTVDLTEFFQIERLLGIRHYILGYVPKRI